MHVYKIVEPKSEVHAYFTSKQHRGCGASTSAVRKSEFKERGMKASLTKIAIIILRNYSCTVTNY